MYFRRPTITGILDVNEFYANLSSIAVNQDYAFDFTYSISQREALKANALKVKVSIYSALVTADGVITPSLENGTVDASLLVQNMRTQLVTAKTSKQQQESFLIHQNVSDVTAYISNGNSKNTADDSAFRVQRLRSRTTQDLARTNEQIPVLIFNNSQATPNDTDLRKLYEEMLRKGQDPTEIVDMTRYSITPHDNTQGLSSRVRTRLSPYSAAQQALNAHIIPAVTPATSSATTESFQVMGLVTEVDDILDISVPMMIPQLRRKQSSGRDLTTVYVQFELMNIATGAVIQTITKVLDMTKHVQLYYTPREPPKVKVSAHNQQFVMLDVQPADIRTLAISVYRKKISRSSTVIEDYTPLTVLTTTSKIGQVFKYRAESPVDEIHVYRFIPQGRSGILGFDFTNAVVSPPCTRFKNAVALSLQPVAEGIQIDVREFPSSVVSIQILVRNLSKFVKDFSAVSTPILIDNAEKTVQLATTIDQNVVDGEYYEYAVRLYHRDGLTETAGQQTISYARIQAGRVTTLLNSVVVTSTDTVNVTFQLASSIISSDLDVVKDLLESKDILKYFNNDVNREREFLNSLIAHNVQRVDLMTGVREDFGVMTIATFDDALLREKNSVSPLQSGRKYRYEVNVLIRKPETLFDSLIKEKRDSSTKKPYTFNPAKYLHPITLNKGTLVTTAGLKALFGLDQMLYGSIGVTQTLDVSLADIDPQPLEIQASRFDRDLNVITWRVQGNISEIDHFLIAKDSGGIQTMVGKVHSEFQHGNCQYFHDLTLRDLGEFRYVITPVFNDYTVGKPVLSNSIVIEGI